MLFLCLIFSLVYLSNFARDISIQQYVHFNSKRIVKCHSVNLFFFVVIDSSDFVRLDPLLAEELHHTIHDGMNNSSQSGSSISDNFRFVQPLHRGPNPYREGGFHDE